jgi:hypothetical protein
MPDRLNKTERIRRLHQFGVMTARFDRAALASWPLISR